MSISSSQHTTSPASPSKNSPSKSVADTIPFVPPLAQPLSASIHATSKPTYPPSTQPHPPSTQPTPVLIDSDDDNYDDDSDDVDKRDNLIRARVAERLARVSLRDEPLPDFLYEFLLRFGSLTTPDLFCTDRLGILLDLLRDLSSILMVERPDVFVVDPLAASRLPQTSAECVASIGDSQYTDRFDPGLLCRRFPRCGRRRLSDPANKYIFYFHLSADCGPVLAWYDVGAQALNGYDPASPRTTHNLETEGTFSAVQALRLLLFVSSKLDSRPLLTPSEVVALDFAESQYYRSFALPSLDTSHGIILFIFFVCFPPPSYTFVASLL